MATPYGSWEGRERSKGAYVAESGPFQAALHTANTLHAPRLRLGASLLILPAPALGSLRPTWQDGSRATPAGLCLTEQTDTTSTAGTGCVPAPFPRRTVARVWPLDCLSRRGPHPDTAPYPAPLHSASPPCAYPHILCQEALALCDLRSPLTPLPPSFCATRRRRTASATCGPPVTPTSVWRCTT